MSGKVLVLMAKLMHTHAHARELQKEIINCK